MVVVAPSGVRHRASDRSYSAWTEQQKCDWLLQETFCCMEPMWLSMKASLKRNNLFAKRCEFHPTSPAHPQNPQAPHERRGA